MPPLVLTLWLLGSHCACSGAHDGSHNITAIDYVQSYDLSCCIRSRNERWPSCSAGLPYALVLAECGVVRRLRFVAMLRRPVLRPPMERRPVGGVRPSSVPPASRANGPSSIRLFLRAAFRASSTGKQPSHTLTARARPLPSGELTSDRSKDLSEQLPLYWEGGGGRVGTRCERFA